MSNMFETFMARSGAGPDVAQDEPDNPLERAVQRGEQAREQKLRGSLLGAVDANPDQHAKVLGLARQTGLPADVVDRNFPEIHRSTTVDGFADMLRDAPKVRSFLLDPDVAKLAADDVPALAQIGKSVDGFYAQPWTDRNIVNPARTSALKLRQGFEAGAASVSAERSQALDVIDTLEAIPGAASETARDELKRRVPAGVTDPLRYALSLGDPDVALYARVKDPETRRQVRERFGAEMRFNVAGAIDSQRRLDAIPKDPGLTKALQSGDLGDLADAILSDPGILVRVPLESLASMAPGLALAPIIGPAAGMGAGSLLMERNAELLETVQEAIQQSGRPIDETNLLEALADPELMARARSVAIRKGLPVAFFDALSGGLASKSLVRGPLAAAGRGRLVQEGAEIAAQMPVQGVLGAAGEVAGQVASGQEVNPVEAALEAVGELGSTIVEVPALATVAGGRETANREAARFVDDAGRAQRAATNAAALDGQVEQVRASKLLERAPDRLEAFLSATAGEDATVYIPAEKLATFFQSFGEGDPFDLSDTDIPAQMPAALASGGDVAIPAATYLARFAPMHHKALRDDLRLGIGEYTPNEAQAFNDGMADVLQERYEAALARIEEEQATAAPSESVFEDVRRQLVAAGRSLDVAEKEASVFRSFFRTMGERAGVDALDLYRQAGVKIRGILPERLRDKNIDRLDLLIDRLRRKDVPTERRIFGDSLLEFVSKRGGLVDSGGELAGMDADRWHRDKKFRRRLIRADETPIGATMPGMGRTEAGIGYGLDDVALAAWEAGYFPGANRPTPDDLLEAIREELGGRTRFSEQAVDADADQMRQALDELDQVLGELGIDIDTATNAEIKAALDGMTAQAPDEDALYQAEGADGRKPAAVLKGDELAPADADRKTLMAAARGAYRQLQEGEPATHPQLGEITFTRAGWDKLRHTSADVRKWQMIPALREIVAGADYVGQIELNKDRSDNIAAFHWLEADVELAGKRLRVGVQVAEDRQGRKFYSLNQDLEAWGQKYQPPGLSRTIKAGGQGAAGEGGTSLDQKVAGAADGFNLAILKRPAVDRRGAIEFRPGEARITLFEKADLSTVMHEAGHLFAETLRSVALTADAPQPLRDDWNTVAAWLGMAADAPIAREQHEQFARGFEAYLFEGKAPSVELQGVFARMRAWLVGIYRSIRRLNVTLTDDVRGVFDRMLASEDEIRAVVQQQHATPIFADAAAAGMTDAEFAAYTATADKATRSAEEDLLKRAMSELTRERRRWWKEERTKVRDQVEAEVNGRPVYQALHWLQTGKFLDGEREGVAPARLSRDVLVSTYGEEVLRFLPRSVPPIWTREGGIHPDLVADLFGLASGDQLVQQLMQVQPRRRLIETETDVRMRERHGDLLRDGTIQEEALAALHGDERATFLHTELRALARQSGQREPTPRSEAKRIAAAIIAREPVKRATLAGRFATAEAQAARAAEAALAKGDLREATKQKRRQLLNHHLFMESRRAADDVDGAVRYLSKFQRQRTMPSLDQEYLEQIQGMLERFDLGRGVSLRQIERRKSLAAWIAEQEAAGNQVDVPEKLRNDAYRRHYKDLPVEELRGLVDAVKNIEHLGRLKKRLLTKRAKAEFEAVVEDVVGAIYANNDVLPEPVEYSPTWSGRLKQGFSDLHAELTKMEFLFRQLDGHRDQGTVWTHLFKPIADADNAETAKTREVKAGLDHAFRRYGRLERTRWMSQRVHVPEVGKSFTRAEVLALALNWGNEGNRKAVLDGMKWQPEQAEAVLRRMDRRDWETVQDIWDLIDSLWPETAALQKDLTGIVPAKVDALSFTATAPDGPVSMRGGYYPLKYDAAFSYLAQQRQEKQAAEGLFSGNYTRPATRKGHTIERVGSGGQRVRLDLGVLTEHLKQVVHDQTHRRAVYDVDRLLQNKDVREAIETTAGRAMHRRLRPWLQAIARDPDEPHFVVERVLSRARAGATVVNMGLKITTALSQILGVMQTVERVGVMPMLRATSRFLRNPFTMKAKVDFVLDRSEMMRARRTSFDRDVRDQLKQMTLGGPMAPVRRSFFYLTGLMDMAVAVPSWMAAYGEGMERFQGDEGKAIDHADSVVRMTQSAGGAKDLAAIQQHGELMKLFTMFYSYFSVLYNLGASRIQQTRGVRDFPQLVASAFFLWFAPAILGELITGRGPDDDDDEAGWAALKIAGYPFQTIPIVRDFAQFLTGDYGFAASPAFDAIEIPGRTVKAIAKGDFDEGTARDVVLTAGYWAALPARQVWITGSYLYDLMTGEADEFSLRDVFFARKPG